MTETARSTELPVPRAGLLELGLSDDEIDSALKRRPAVLGGSPGVAPGSVFSPEAVERTLKALRALRHTKTRRWKGRPLDPDPWQVVWIIAPIFGWVYDWDHPDDELAGTRVVREAFVEIPRKNGKTSLSTGLLIVLLCADGEPGPEVYSAAVDKSGANRIIDDAKTMIRSSPALLKMVKPKNLQAGLIKYPRNGGIMRALSKIAEAAHGLNVSGAVIDELHVHKRRDLLDAIITGTGARDQPLVVIITTADEGGEHSIYAEYHDRTEQIAAGVKSDPSHYGVIWRADESDDPFADETIAKANPGVGTTVTWDYLRGEAEKARTTPSYLPTYQRLHLNVRAKSTAGLIRIRDWNAQPAIQSVVPEQLTGRLAFGGLDLSSTTDFTAATLWFPNDPANEDDGGVVLPAIWVPEERVDELEHLCQVPLTRWIDDGWLHTTEGNVVDYSEVRRHLNHWRKDLGFVIQQVGYDPWNATETVNELLEDGWDMVPVRQGYSSLSAPTKLLERRVAQQLVVHGGNPALRWMADSLHIRRDENDNVRPVKPNRQESAKRIDAMVALIMALFCWQRYEPPAQPRIRRLGA